MTTYPKIPYVLGEATAVSGHAPMPNKMIYIRRRLPVNVIVVHGVNDVGTSYSEIESGLCKGLQTRLQREFRSAGYRLPTAADRDVVEPDPDAVFYKRMVDADTDSPVIPFYWGYREVSRNTRTLNGEKIDRHGNRLDKDLSKGGGPFGNATNSLPDMWGKGLYAPLDVVRDPTHPLKTAPGHLYMVLAAQRLAALISMIRDYDPGETVTVIAHSQGCLVTLLAQAMLMEMAARPADTLILNNPPYSLLDNQPWDSTIVDKMRAFGGKDEATKIDYVPLRGSQSMAARLQTLVNIVRGVTDAPAVPTAPVFATLNDHLLNSGVVEFPWTAAVDRDNRGKVYLYFSPEDMTVAFDNVRGIGWQGVPDYIDGTEWKDETLYDRWGYFPNGSHTMVERQSSQTTRRPLIELGERFYQRVFTLKKRVDRYGEHEAPVLVGQAPYDFALRIQGEDAHAHVEAASRGWRATPELATWPINQRDTPRKQRQGIRTINGEALPIPVEADLRGANQVDPSAIPDTSKHAGLPVDAQGPCEYNDPIDAREALVSDQGLKRTYKQGAGPHAGTQLASEESVQDATLRWQHEVSAKSFHSAIVGSVRNHEFVTAYDVAIGKGAASTDPRFYAYLCAVADWRLKKLIGGDQPRPGILTLEIFLDTFDPYFSAEPAWRKELILGNAEYYSSGILPACLPLLSGELWNIVIAETVGGVRVQPPKKAKP